jgi:hypothetical protein
VKALTVAEYAAFSAYANERIEARNRAQRRMAR